MTRILTAFLICLACAGHTFAKFDAFQPPLNVHVVNVANVPDDVLVSARDRVERIFSDAGIRIAWDGTDGLELTLVLVGPAETKRFDPRNSDLTGLAVGNDGQGPRRAFVFADRVHEQSWSLLKSMKTPNANPQFGNRKAVEAMLLSVVIAHEAGHLLLPHGSHSASGIMRPFIEQGEIGRAVQGQLFFESKQSELMRKVLLAW